MRRSLDVCGSCVFLKKKLGKYECLKDDGWLNGMLKSTYYQALTVGDNCARAFEQEVFLQFEFSIQTEKRRK